MLFELNQNFRRIEAGANCPGRPLRPWLPNSSGLGLLWLWWHGPGSALANWEACWAFVLTSRSKSARIPRTRASKALPFLQSPEKLPTFDVCDLFCITYRSLSTIIEDKLGWKSVPFLKSCAHSSLFHAGPGTLWLPQSVLWKDLMHLFSLRHKGLKSFPF